MKRFFLMTLLVTLVVVCFAEKVDGNAGKHGMQMLKINSGIAVTAASGTGEFFSDDAFGFLVNPVAGLINKSNAISFTNNNWLFGTTYNSIGISNYAGKQSYGIAFRYLDYGKIEGKDELAQDIGDFHPLDANFAGNYAFRITPNHLVGFNGGLFYEKLDTESSIGVLIDFGYAYLTPFQGLKFAFAAKNYGTSTKMNNEKLETPSSIEVSAVQNFNFKTVAFSFQTKTLKFVDDDNFKIVLGLSSVINNILKLQAGYKINYDAESFTAGVGINLKKLSVDYAYSPTTNYLNDSAHLVGLTLKFK